MYIPDLKLQELPEFVEDSVDATDCDSMTDLHECFNRAVKLNEKKGYIPKFGLGTESFPYEDYTYPKAFFYYYRKPNKQERQSVESYNHRMIITYNKFSEDNPELVKLLKMEPHASKNI